MMHCTFLDCVSKTRYVLPVAMHFVRALTKALNSVLYWISGTQTSFSEDASFNRSMVYMKWSLDHSFLPPTKQIGEIHSFLLGSSIQLVWCESKLWGSWNQKLVAVWVALGCLLRWCRTFFSAISSLVDRQFYASCSLIMLSPRTRWSDPWFDELLGVSMIDEMQPQAIGTSRQELIVELFTLVALCWSLSACSTRDEGAP